MFSRFSEIQRASRSLAKTVFFVFSSLFSKPVFNIFWNLFLSPLGPFLDPMLGLCWELFRVFFALKMRSYLEVVFASIFHRFRTPWSIKNWAPVYTKHTFSLFYTSYLKFVFGLDFGAQKATKIEPKRLQNRFRNELEIWAKLNVDFEPNLVQLGGQLGLNLGPKRRPKRAEKCT